MLRTDELRNASILIFANKQDLPRAASATELADAMDMHKYTGKFAWFVQPCCATSGEGLYEGLDWLTKAIERAAERRV